MTRKAGGPLAFLNDRAAFVRRFVLAEVLAPPRGKLLSRSRGPARAASSAPVAPPGKPESK